MATGIRDKVALLGMGCSKFGERWNDNAEDLVVESFSEAVADAGIEKNQIEAMDRRAARVFKLQWEQHCFCKL